MEFLIAAKGHVKPDTYILYKYTLCLPRVIDICVIFAKF